MNEKLLRWLHVLYPKDKLVRVVSWRPSWDPHGIAWPMVVMDRYRFGRIVTVKIWDWDAVLELMGYPEFFWYPDADWEPGPM